MQVATVIDARPAALVDSKAVGWGELRPLLNEAAGAECLQEVILDRVLDTALADAGLMVGPDEVAAEQRQLLETLDRDPDVALRLLDELRARQGLGRTRFAGLLRRNAALRALVRDQVQVTDPAVTLNLDDVPFWQALDMLVDPRWFEDAERNDTAHDDRDWTDVAELFVKEYPDEWRPLAEKMIPNLGVEPTVVG
ncbi:MAG: hypothetical protein IH804_07640, partial [Planctomycetes bacterium]|nr:hypothetical protein [Planctomycetota bacterium]